MLILTRSLNQRIIIKSDIFVEVLEIKGNQVKIGVQAPEDTPVHREEIYKKILSENGILTKEFRKCTWTKKENDGDSIFTAACKDISIFYDDLDYTFCPYCSKKIVFNY